MGAGGTSEADLKKLQKLQVNTTRHDHGSSNAHLHGFLSSKLRVLCGLLLKKKTVVFGFYQKCIHFLLFTSLLIPRCKACKLQFIRTSDLDRHCLTKQHERNL